MSNDDRIIPPGYRIMGLAEQEAFVQAMREGLHITSAGVLHGAGWTTTTVPCPYCKRPVERTVEPDEINEVGEHCYCCHLPFGIDENGDAYGQDDPRWLE